MDDQLVVSRRDASRLEEIEPLWRSLVAHHETLDALPPVRSADDAWRRRRAQYAQWLSAGDAALFVAELAGEPQGYLMLTIGEAGPTWEIGNRAGEIETLAVLPSARGRGVGAALMEAASSWTASHDARATVVGVAHSNDGAIRFYERHGFRPFYVLMLSGPG